MLGKWVKYIIILLTSGVIFVGKSLKVHNALVPFFCLSDVVEKLVARDSIYQILWKFYFIK